MAFDTALPLFHLVKLGIPTPASAPTIASTTIISSNENFTIEIDNLTLSPEEEYLLDITFGPLEEGEHPLRLSDAGGAEDDQDGRTKSPLLELEEPAVWLKD